MKAVLTGEVDDLVGVNLRDNNGVEHVMDVRKSDGKITGHQQDSYPDKAVDRNDVDNEHFNQARRFARYHVHRERGYDTLEPRRDPDRIAAVALAVGSLSPETLLESLGEYHQQLDHYQVGGDPVLETPEVSANALVWVKQDLSVALGSDATTELTDTLTERGVFDALAEPTNADADPAIREALSDHGIDPTAVSDAAGATLLEEMGPLEVCWRQGGETQCKTADSTGMDLGERADARLQLFSDMYEFTDVAGFQRSVVHHLRCQIRDCFIRMGIAPPDGVRIQGPGFYENVSWYEHLGFYEPYNDPRREVDTWLEEHTPEAYRV